MFGYKKSKISLLKEIKDELRDIKEDTNSTNDKIIEIINEMKRELNNHENRISEL